MNILLWICILPQVLGSFTRHLSFTIPMDRVTLPLNVTTALYRFSLPDLASVHLPMNRSLVSLGKTLSNGTLYGAEKQHDYYPLFDLRTSIETNIGIIFNLMTDLAEILQPARIGKDYDTRLTMSLDVQKAFSELGFSGINSLASSMRKFKNEPKIINGSHDKVVNVRSSEDFSQAVFFATQMHQEMALFSQKFRSFVDTLYHLKTGQTDKLRENFFYSDELETLLDSKFAIIDVRFFHKTESKFEVILEIATHSELAEYHKYFNVQYFNTRLADTYYSRTGSDELHTLSCIAPSVCYPTTSPCSRALHNESIYNIMSHCNFVESNDEYDLIPGLGVVVNTEPKNENLKALLKEQKVEASTYPFLFTWSGCIGLNDGELKMCFLNDREIIYSRFQSEIWSYISPMWYSTLLNYLSDVPLILFLFLSFTIYFFTVFGCSLTKQRFERFKKDYKASRAENKKNKTKDSKKGDKSEAKGSKKDLKRSDSTSEVRELRTLLKGKNKD